MLLQSERSLPLACGRYNGAEAARAERLGAFLWAIVWAFFPLFQALIAMMIKNGVRGR
jgi:hypothetical protein